MSRSTISFTDPNYAWVEAQLTNGEYSSKSDLVNDAIRRLRAERDERELLKQALQAGLDSGVSELTAEQVLENTKRKLGLHANL